MNAAAVVTQVVVGLLMPAGAENADAPSGQIERGKYLVHRVAMCVECHSPRNAQGDLVPGRHLQGGTIPLESPYSNQRWAFRAPKLAGLPSGWSAPKLVRFLMEGDPDPNFPRGPMPPYRFNREDAQAIVAYLASLR